MVISLIMWHPILARDQKDKEDRYVDGEKNMVSVAASTGQVADMILCLIPTLCFICLDFLVKFRDKSLLFPLPRGQPSGTLSALRVTDNKLETYFSSSSPSSDLKTAILVAALPGTTCYSQSLEFITETRIAAERSIENHGKKYFLWKKNRQAYFFLRKLN